ncbi:MAG: amino acid adenylation domain-containing protein, partial [bacterium]|nr:amino acid adenylation domain-containing protein [bacterium]
VPVGVAGELAIGGTSVARGYRGRPELSAERFVPDPTCGDPSAGERLYRTGDLARWLPDGTIEFLGRIDHQVKLRGFRIELGEIESVLGEHLAVRDVAVVVHELDQQLVAFVVSDQEPAPEAELRDLMTAKLPGFMVPSALVFPEALPLLPNGKVDRAVLGRRALLAPDALRADFVVPADPTEELLAGIWAEVLHREQVGAGDDFFALGGHSLLATQVVSRIRDTFGVELPLRNLFEASTPAELARTVRGAQQQARGVAPPPLVPVGRDQELPLSFAQQRLWFLDQLEPASAAYNMPNVLRLPGAVDAARLEWIFNVLVRRHEVLRTTFPAASGRPRQVIAPRLELALPLVDLRSLVGDRREAEARRLAADEAGRPFDLRTGPLIRPALLRLADDVHVGARLRRDDHVLLVTMHHIVSDGWSMGIFSRELRTLYASSARGQAELPELPIQYADFAHWQRQWLVGEVLEAELAYWRLELAGAPPRLELPWDRPRPAVLSLRGRSREIKVSEAVSGALAALSREHGVTLFMTLLAAFDVLLSRYSGREDIVVGSPIAGRKRREIEALIGFFVNTLVLRTDLSGDPPFVPLRGNPEFPALLERVRHLTLDAYAHQDLPFESLVEELQPPRDTGSHPLFQVMLTFQNIPAPALESPETPVSSLAIEWTRAKFDLGLALHQGADALEGSWQYSTDLFDAVTIDRLAAHFATLLAGIAAAPARRLSELPMLGKAERHQLSVEWNDSRRGGREKRLVHELFEAQARRTPDAAAVIFQGSQVSYRELDRRANRLARRLRPEVLVGILMERSVEMIVAVLGILKAGGAYLPLDPSDPPERLAFTLEDSRVPVLLAQPSTVARLPAASLAGVEVLADWDDVAAPGEAANPISGVTPAHLAYVIYTSGSTGRPKGAMVEHRSLTDFLEWVDQAFLDAGIRSMPLVSSITFDASLKQLFTPLLRGAPLRALAPEVAPDPRALLEALAASGEEAFNCVPSLWEALVTAMESGAGAVPGRLRCLWVGGEPLREDLVRRTRALYPELEIGNVYGPTEATSLASWAPGTDVGCLTIGRPLANTWLYVLDQTLRPVPIGVAGELAIAGPGVARGYLRRPQWTAERFVPSPLHAQPGWRLYRTGDRVRFLSDGRLDFL